MTSSANQPQRETAPTTGSEQSTAAPAPCCGTAEQSTCCEPSAKQGCCGAEATSQQPAPSTCGCR